MDFQLSGRTVLVTGASNGVGLATARMLLAEGANVGVCARDGDRLAAAFTDLGLEARSRLLQRTCDVLDAGAVGELITGLVGEFGGVDGVVNNAGGSLMRPPLETTDEQWVDQMRLKVLSVLNTVRAALPWLRKASGASVVNVNAILARQPEVRLAATSAARAALLNLSTSLANELAVDRVRVNSVCLGLIDTGQWRRRYETSGSPSDFASWTAELAADRGIALGRFGEADEVAFPIVSLLSPRSSYVTGATLDVGGGVARYV
ncbi:SDR family oxidoreductase [Amycolatopsis sp. NPDC005232]|uniref:SDR family oxidoreductase n=1 Tax=Amycolatopsis sp. NPDC005232 TaxID=3157027 RepID=UPI0033A28FD3